MVYDRTRRARAIARVLLVAIAAIIVACGPSPRASPDSSGEPTNGTAPEVSIPASQVDANTKCLLDHGFKLVGTSFPGGSGAPPAYEVSTEGLTAAEASQAASDCAQFAPSPRVLSDVEIRVVYDRWVRERECLIGLGYHPTEPPTFETFISDWNTGPWDPLMGVDTGAWTDAEYQAAKKACTLEFYGRQ